MIGSKPGSSRLLTKVSIPEVASLGILDLEIDDFGDEVARQSLIEIFFGELNRDRIVSEVRCCTVASGSNFDRWIQLDTFAA